MKRILACCGLVVVLPILALVILGLILPNNWSVDRSVTIDVPPEEVYEEISDFRRWPEWVKWQAPGSEFETEFTFTGAPTGAGSVLRWESADPAIGSGTFTMTESDPARGIRYAVAIESQNLEGTGSVLFQTVEAGTLVTWHDEGELPPVIGGLMSWIFNAGLGTKFEDDLARLKKNLEGANATPPAVENEAVPVPAGG